MISGTDRLSGLRDFAQVVSSSRTIGELVDSGARTAQDLLTADVVSLAQYEPDGADLRVLRRVGPLSGTAEPWPTDTVLPAPRPAGPGGHPATENAYWTVSAGERGVDSNAQALLERLGCRHVAAFDVRVGEQTWGQLLVGRDHAPFGHEELATGLTFVGLLSSGLARLDLLADLARLAYTDPLTGLANRRAADDWLEQRLAAPQPFPPVSVVLCDINGLKLVNDAFGHTAGDELVRVVASHLAAAADGLPDALAARIGGDEFVLLVDGADEPQVQEAVATLAGTPLPHSAGIAVGAATTVSRPAGAESTATASRALMRLADAAQYRHKRTRQLRTGVLASTADAVGVVYPRVDGNLADAVLDQLAADADQTVERRLQVVADALAETFDVASWWVNRRDTGQLLSDVLGRVMRADARGELIELDFVSGMDFEPADYPDTARALTGGSYYASLTDGEAAERALLARMGYVASLGAGEQDALGTQWLLELFADPQTSPGLFVAQPLLRLLVHVAVLGATPWVLPSAVSYPPTR